MKIVTLAFEMAQLKGTGTAKLLGRNDWIIIGVILALTYGIFQQVQTFDFLSNWDDDGYVINNPDIQKISGENIKKLFSSPYKSNYQPVSMLSYMVEFSMFQLNVRELEASGNQVIGPDGQAVLSNPYHMTNLLFHLLCAFLVYVFIKKLVNRIDVATISAFFFAIHPMHIESVAWISERKDVMYAAFFLWALIAYLNYLYHEENKEQFWKSKVYWSVLGIYLLSILSKPMAVTFPMVLLAVDYYKDRKIDAKNLIEKTPFFILSLIFGIVALKTQGGSAMSIVPDFSFIDRFCIVCYGVVFYIIKLFIPTGMASIHYYPDNSMALPWEFYSAPIIIALIAVLIWKAKSFRKELIFGLAFFLFSISIVLQIIPVGHAFAAERYSYVPYIGLVFIIGQLYAWCWDNNKGKWLMIGAIGIAAIVFPTMTYDELPTWKNSMKLYTNTIQEYPDVAHAYWMRGNVKKDFGNSANTTNAEAAKNLWAQSIADYDKAILLDPEYSKAYFNRGGSYANINQTDKALSDYNKAIEYDPNYEPAYNNRGNSYLNMKQYGKAIADYKKALEINPQYAVAWQGLGKVYHIQNKLDSAIVNYTTALEISPKYAEVMYNRGVAYYNNKQQDLACQDWKLATELQYQPAIKIVTQYCK
ncbi:MAG: tetratricopeptide repeat protein [Flavobacteriales bacterium]|nr:tetratricopeptide repeat protein [Flavobacteriales bacterium]